MSWLIKKDDAKPITVRVIDAEASPIAGLSLTSSWKWTKSGGAIGNAAGTLTDRTLGVYEYTPTAGEVDTLGNAQLSFHDTTNGYVSVGGGVQVVAFDPRVEGVLIQSGTASGQLLTSNGVASVDVISVNSNGNAANGLENIGDDYLADGHVDAHVLTIANDAITSAAIAANALNGKGDWNTTTPPTASQNAAAVWDEARSGHTTNGTYGAVSEWAGANSLTASDVWTYATRTLTAYNWGGAGAYAITVNVKEGVTNISGATVSFTQGSDVYSATTNSSGNASFSLDAGTFTLAIWKAGYTFTPESVTVSANATLNKTVTAVSAPAASDPGQCIIYHTARERTGAIKSGVVYTYQVVGGDDAVVDGMGTTTLNSAETTATSSGTSANNVSFPLARGSKAKIKRGTGAYRGFTVPNFGSAQLVDCLTETVTGIDV